MVFDYVILRQNEILKVEIAEIKKENEKLERALNRQDANFIKELDFSKKL